MLKWVGRLGLVVVLLALLAQVMLVPLAETALTRTAARLPVDEVEVKVASFPAWELLQGKIDELNIKAKNVRLKELTLAELQGSFSEVRFSWWASWHDGNLIYSFREPAEIRFIVTEENLTQYLSRRLQTLLQDLTVSINGDKVQLRAALTVAGQKLPLMLIGHLILEPPDLIQLKPERIQVGTFVPGRELQEKLAGHAAFRLPLENLPLRVELHRLVGGRGQFTLHGLVQAR